MTDHENHPQDSLSKRETVTFNLSEENMDEIVHNGNESIDPDSDASVSKNILDNPKPHMNEEDIITLLNRLENNGMVKIIRS